MHSRYTYAHTEEWSVDSSCCAIACTVQCTFGHKVGMNAFKTRICTHKQIEWSVDSSCCAIACTVQCTFRHKVGINAFKTCIRTHTDRVICRQ